MTNAPERITLKKLWADLLEQFNLERGLGYTTKAFLIKPGQAVQKYLFEDRKPFTKPLSFLLLTSAVTTFLMLEFVIKKQAGINGIGSPEWEAIPDLIKPGLKLLLVGVQKYFNLVYLLSLPLVTLASYWVLRKKYEFNLAEFLVINTYIFSIQSILYLFNIPLFALKSQSIFTYLPSILMIGYFVFAYKQIFRLGTWKAIGHSLLIYLISQVLNAILFGLIILAGIFFA